MSENEFMVFAKGLKSAYTSPNFLPDEFSLKLWYRMLSDIPYQLAEAAAYKYIVSNKFPPTISEIRGMCVSLTSQDARDPLGGWGLIQRAIGRYGYMQRDAAMKYIQGEDCIAAKVVELMGWNELCMSENPVADRANFRACYERYAEREREDARLPQGIKALISGINTEFFKASDNQPELLLRCSDSD